MGYANASSDQPSTRVLPPNATAPSTAERSRRQCFSLKRCCHAWPPTGFHRVSGSGRDGTRGRGVLRAEQKVPRGQSWRGLPARYACRAAGLPAAGLGKSRVVQAPSSVPRLGCGARGNPVGIRDCPAAVSRNERRHQRWPDDKRAGKRRSLGACVRCARLRVRIPASRTGRAPRPVVHRLVEWADGRSGPTGRPRLDVSW
jgi:hypothetical protein